MPQYPLSSLATKAIFSKTAHIPKLLVLCSVNHTTRLVQRPAIDLTRQIIFDDYAKSTDDGRKKRSGILEMFGRIIECSIFVTNRIEGLPL